MSYTGCWLCLDAELAIGQYRMIGDARNLRSVQPLASPAEDVITGLEFPLDLPMCSLVGQQDETKKPSILASFPAQFFGLLFYVSYTIY